MNIVRFFKILSQFLKYLPSAISEHWKRTAKETILIEALGTDRGRSMLAEAMMRPMKERLKKEKARRKS